VTHVIEPAPAGHLAEALDEVRRSAQQLLSDVGNQPRLLRIRAGDIVVELEWTGQLDGPAAPALGGPPAPAPVALALAGPPASAPAALAASAAECGATDPPLAISAPTVGTFYRAPQPGAAPFVSEGDEVRRGQQIGIVEAMKLMIPVESEHDGVVATIHVADNTPVEYGQPLITLSPVTG
jgi:acetyl-CoA carboxylase biotin carboxyl carrier protein